MTQRPITPTLDRVTVPADMRGFSDADLRRLADELRAETISAVSVTGGHLGAGLGVVELTVAYFIPLKFGSWIAVRIQLACD